MRRLDRVGDIARDEPVVYGLLERFVQGRVDVARS